MKRTERTFRMKYRLAAAGLAAAMLAGGPALRGFAGETQESADVVSDDTGSLPDAAGALAGAAGALTDGGVSITDVNEALDHIDDESLRQKIRDALTAMDDLGISPNVVAENVFGIQVDPAKSVESLGAALMEDVQEEVHKQTESLADMIWESFVGMLGDMFSPFLSVFGPSGSGSP